MQKIFNLCSHVLSPVLKPFRMGKYADEKEYIKKQGAEKVFKISQSEYLLTQNHIKSRSDYLRINKEPALVKNKIFTIWGRMVANLPIEEFEKEGIHILRVGGRLDATSAPILERKLVHIVETPGAKIVINLSSLSYLSSAGLRVMLAASKRLKNTNGTVAFSNLQDSVMEIVKLAGFEHILKFYPTEAMALKALKTSLSTE